jgi:hypothetical protein
MDVAEKLLKLARIDINPQQPSATFQGPDAAKPALGGLRRCLNWWSRGDLNPQPMPVFAGRNGKCC